MTISVVRNGHRHRLVGERPVIIEANRCLRHSKTGRFRRYEA